MAAILKRLKVLISVSDRIPLLTRQIYRYHLYNRVIFGIVMGILPLAAVVARKTLAAPKWQIGLISAAPIGGYFITSLWSMAIERKKPIDYIFWPELIGGLILFTIAFSTASISFVIIYICFWMVYSLTIPAHTVMMRNCYPQPVRASVFSFITSRTFFVGIAFALISGKLMDINEHLYRVLFPVAGIASIAAAFCIRRIKIGENLVPDNGQDSVSPLKSIYRILTGDRDFMKFMALTFISGLANLMMIPVLVLYLTDVLGVNYQQAARTLAILPWATMALTAPLWGRFVDKYNPMITRGLFDFVWAVVPLLYFLSRDLALIYIAVSLLGIVRGGSMLTWHLGVMYFSPQQFVPRYMGVHIFLTGVRGIAGPFIGIVLAGLLGIKAVFLISSIMMATASAMMFLMGIKRRRENVDYDDNPDMVNE